MNGAGLMIRALEREGVGVLFGYPGGAILPFYDALVDGRLQHILVRHEQAAALAADGYARASGKVGVCVATSGPGATNLVTGIANAFLDSVPVVAITGQVSSALLGTDAFQEVDIFGITMPVVKHSFLVRRVTDLPHVVREAFRVAASGRPGPVLIDLPKDVASATADGLEPLDPEPPEPPPAPDPGALRRAVELLRECRRPVLYAGGGIGIARAVTEFRELVDTTRIPTVSTLKGLGVLGSEHDLFLGMLGMHGSRAANLAVQECDLLLCVGARFDDRATSKLDGFAPHAKVVHLDIDLAEVGKRRRPDVAILGDLRVALKNLAMPLDIDDWRRTCLGRKTPTHPIHPLSTHGVCGPKFLQRLSAAVRHDTIITSDVGQHQMWVAQHCRFRRPEDLLTSGGLGTMGYGLPAAIGAQLARPHACVINVSGDGSIMMNLQELATVVRYRLPLKIVLFDNKGLGMVRQWQRIFFRQRWSQVDLSDNPDFVGVARAMGLPAFRVDHEAAVDNTIERLVSEPGPMFVHLSIDPWADVWPLVPPDKTNSTMLEGGAA